MNRWRFEDVLAMRSLGWLVYVVYMPSSSGFHVCREAPGSADSVAGGRLRLEWPSQERLSRTGFALFAPFGVTINRDDRIY